MRTNKRTPEERIQALASKFPQGPGSQHKQFEQELAAVLARSETDSDKMLADVINKVVEQVSKVRAQPKPHVTVNPKLSMPAIPAAKNYIKVDVPKITIPPVKIECAKKWNFTIHRLENGLIKSITAEKVA